jgi:hypothetical protein
MNIEKLIPAGVMTETVASASNCSAGRLASKVAIREWTPVADMERMGRAGAKDPEISARWVAIGMEDKGRPAIIVGYSIISFEAPWAVLASASVEVLQVLSASL